ncbi:twitching motility protein PilT [Thermococcus siculi]|uniref:Twitching motility protein PilT n=1 Tax=Thermococcus siculi TaxID=72803 RepID=A0A2Z2MRP9_9EURY|nr:type II toxin-antitoxin system VapC family toxin [Thermococcus siculi]ASJ09434.1 twitching motility protein PilT [Thermococcus siculi]
MKLLIDTSLFVYLNANMGDELAERLDRFYTELVRDNEAYTNVLVLDELIHVSRRKYGVSYPDTISFIEDIILPAVRVLPITFNDYLTAKELILKYNLRPSDALHIATIQNNGLQAIVSEDEDFDKLPIKRLWLEV